MLIRHVSNKLPIEGGREVSYLGGCILTRSMPMIWKSGLEVLLDTREGGRLTSARRYLLSTI
jgi:hypothetical protein